VFVYSLYPLAFISVGGALPLMHRVYQRHGVSRFWVLPLISMIFSMLYMQIDMNRAWGGTMISTFNDDVLSVIQNLCDMFSSVALGWAYVFRFRVVVRAWVNMPSSSAPKWIAHLSWIVAIMPIIYPTVDIVGIIGIYDSWIGSECCGGTLVNDVYGAFNIAWAINEIIMEISFAVILVKWMHSVSKTRKRVFLLTAVALSVDSVGMLAGGIVSLFYSQLGTQIVYFFWLINVWVFMMSNEQVSRLIRSSKHRPFFGLQSSNPTNGSTGTRGEDAHATASKESISDPISTTEP
jgi:hypothetical protein